MACGHGLRQPQGAAGRRRRHPDPRLPGVSGHLVSVGRLEVVLLLVGKEKQEKTAPAHFSFFLPLLVFCSSVRRSCGQVKKDERIYPENFTRILDRLLDGYDNRLRPGFGGKYVCVYVFVATIIFFKSKPVPSHFTPAACAYDFRHFPYCANSPVLRTSRIAITLHLTAPPLIQSI